MTLRPDQALRQALLLKALENSKDPDFALSIALRMERFVLLGDSGPSTTTSTEAPMPEGEAPNLRSEARVPDGGAPKGWAAGARGNDRRRPRWTNSDETRVAELWKQGLSVEEIAARLGRTTASVYARSRKLKLRKERRRAQALMKTNSSAAVVPANIATPSERPDPVSTGFDPGNTEAGAEGDDAPPSDTDAGDADTNSAGEVATDSSPVQASPAETETEEASNQVCEAAPTSMMGSANGEETVPHPDAVMHNSQLNKTSDGKVPSIPFTMETIVQFLRSRDYNVFRIADGRYEIDGERIATAEELVHLANEERSFLGKPEFAM